ncbi:MAG: hypothetical protein JNK76_21235 [Planctomycetales bacterium]|nr:hypothetical protein [Planctomycetales bacterium]MBN8624470.1 hypothetical protein [Planctomycetota bacterium]
MTPSQSSTLSAAPRAHAQRYHFLVPVWGLEYVDRFIETGLPSQLAPGNLPSLPAQHCLYQIFTRTNDLPRLQGAKSFQRLQSLVTVVVTVIDEMDLSQPYNAMTACYEQGIRAGRGVDTAFVFLTPDSIWSDGTFATMDRLQRAGKRAVVVTGLRMREELAVDALRCRYFRRDDQSLAVPPRDLVAHCLDNLHPLSVAHLCDDAGNHSLGHYYYRVGATGLLARCVHIHPLMVRPAVAEQPMETTLDHEYVRRSCPDFNDVHVVTDSDELFCVEFSKSTLHANMISVEPIGDRSVEHFLYWWTNAFHREYFRRTVRIHSVEIDEAAWALAQRQSDAFVDRMLRRLFTSPKWDGLQEMRVIYSSRLELQSPRFLRRTYHRIRRLTRRTLGMTYRGLAALLPITHTTRRLRKDVDLLASHCLTLNDRIARLESALAEIRTAQGAGRRQDVGNDGQPVIEPPSKGANLAA